MSPFLLSTPNPVVRQLISSVSFGSALVLVGVGEPFFPSPLFFFWASVYLLLSPKEQACFFSYLDVFPFFFLSFCFWFFSCLDRRLFFLLSRPISPKNPPGPFALLVNPAPLYRITPISSSTFSPKLLLAVSLTVIAHKPVPPIALSRLFSPPSPPWFFLPAHLQATSPESFPVPLPTFSSHTVSSPPPPPPPQTPSNAFIFLFFLLVSPSPPVPPVSSPSRDAPRRVPNFLFLLQKLLPFFYCPLFPP